VPINEENSDDSSAEVLIENEGEIAEMRKWYDITQ
jgi:hypothetical protein